MALIHLDGFDSYAAVADLLFEYTYAGVTLETSGGRFGGGGVEITNSGQYLTRAIGGITEFWSGFAANISSVNNQGAILFEVKSVSGIEASFVLNPSTGAITANRAENGTVLGTATISGFNNSWHWYEFHYKYDASTDTGIMEFWYDGVQKINVTAANTASNSGVTIVAAQIGSAGDYTVEGVYDDWYILTPTGGGNETRLGDSKIVTLVPDSDAGPNNGTPSTGTNHYACVDEAEWGTSEYLTIANTSGQAEMFGCGTLGSTPTDIWAVKVLAFAEKSDAGAASLETVITSSGTSANDGGHNLSTSYQSYGGIFEVDPHTSAQWLLSGVNAMNIGVQVP